MPSCRSPYVESFHTTAPHIPLPVINPWDFTQHMCSPHSLKVFGMSSALRRWQANCLEVVSYNSSFNQLRSTQGCDVIRTSLAKANNRSNSNNNSTSQLIYVSTFQLQIKRVLLKEGHYHCTEGSWLPFWPSPARRVFSTFYAVGPWRHTLLKQRILIVYKCRWSNSWC